MPCWARYRSWAADGRQVGEGFRRLRPLDRVEELGDAEGGQDADDHDDHRELDQGEPLAARPTNLRFHQVHDPGVISRSTNRSSMEGQPTRDTVTPAPQSDRRRQSPATTPRGDCRGSTLLSSFRRFRPSSVSDRIRRGGFPCGNLGVGASRTVLKVTVAGRTSKYRSPGRLRRCPASRLTSPGVTHSLGPCQGVVK